MEHPWHYILAIGGIFIAASFGIAVWIDYKASLIEKAQREGRACPMRMRKFDQKTPFDTW
ncbi:hypothetical protein [Paraferrimonas sedimenticola]|uniref:Uncharacterized protein n=1 Tax=Paraferrimonas sedimenticola TaxID=375674 RepID=A0AA37W175_9GAMM|nr:hypothetical protein [Paraferrimonas sedimenticola]GLP97090.1 hypothetical protein GCM10007895_23960 [Paraferrimonas sedimenticola]